MGTMIVTEKKRTLETTNGSSNLTTMNVSQVRKVGLPPLLSLNMSNF